MKKRTPPQAKTSTTNPRHLLAVALAAALYAGPTLAEEAAAPAPAVDQPVSEPAGETADAPTGPERFALTVTSGGFRPTSGNSRVDPDGSAIGATVSFGYRPVPHLSLEGEIGLYSREYKTPPMAAPLFTTVDDHMDLSSAGVSGVVKLLAPVGDAVLYAGVGAGYYSSTLTVKGEILGLETEQREESSNDVGYQGILGADFLLTGRHHLGIEYRKLWLEGDFDSLTGGRVPIGGDYLAVSYRLMFR